MPIRMMSDTEDAMKRYTNMVYGLSVAHTSSKCDADDAFQETFLAYHRSNVMWENEEHRKAWLIKTAVNMSRRITMSSWYKRSVPLENAEEKSVDFDYGSSEQNDIMEAIKQLPPKYRTVIWLYYFDEMPVKEIAQALSINENTIRSRLLRGRAALKRLIKEEGRFDI